MKLIGCPPPLLDQRLYLANTQRPGCIENCANPRQRFNLCLFALSFAVHAAPESGIDRQPVALVSHVFGVIEEEWMQRNAAIFTGAFLCKRYRVVMRDSPHSQFSPNDLPSTEIMLISDSPAAIYGQYEVR